MQKISIIVPVYNTSTFLPKCIESLINQTYKNIEIILIDDGSTDDSLDICRQYAEKDKRIIVLTQKNQGPSVARNYALSVATGDFIGFVDSDDYISLKTYEKAVKFMSKNIDMVIWNVDVFSSDNLSYVGWFQKNYFTDNISKKQKLTLDMRFNTPVVPWNKLYKASIIKKKKIFFPDGRLYEDNAFWWKYTMWCKQVYFLPDRLHFYNLRKSSLKGKVISQEKELEIDRIFMVEDVYNYCCENNLVEKNQFLIERLLGHSFAKALEESINKQLIINESYTLLKKIGIKNSIDSNVMYLISIGEKTISKQAAIEKNVKKLIDLSDNLDIDTNSPISSNICRILNDLYEKGYIIELQNLLNILLQKYPDFSEFIRIQADIYFFKTKQYEKALSFYQKYVTLVDNNNIVYDIMSDIYEIFDDPINQILYKQKSLNIKVNRY